MYLRIYHLEIVLLAGCITATEPPTDEGDPLSDIVDADDDGANSERDCDDDDPEIFPGAVEWCDGIDNDCDGLIDDEAEDGIEVWPDTDGDAWGALVDPEIRCSVEAGWADRTGDCDDSDATLNPETTWYRDDDGDGFGADDLGASCSAPHPDAVQMGGDCDDDDPERSPDADEVCDGFDNDCDGTADEDALDALTMFVDTDGDGWGDPASPVQSCWLDGDMVRFAHDCDDTDAAIHPGAHEVCDDTVDHDCSGSPSNGCDVREIEPALSIDAEEGASGGRAVVAEDIDGDGSLDLLLAGVDAESAGTVTLFRGPLSGDVAWRQGALVASSVSFDNFGGSLAWTDVTGDGTEDLLVSSYAKGGASAGASDASWLDGQLHVFAGPVDGHGWSVEDASSTVVGPESGQFATLLHSDDLDGDGDVELVVGSPGVAGSTFYEGAIFLFDGPLTSAEHDHTEAVASIYGDSGYRLPWTLDSWDHDGDGVAVLATSTPRYGTDRGAVLLFDAPAGSLTVADADVVIAGQVADDWLGYSMDFGDLDGDGYEDLAVAAPGIDTISAYAGGAIYVVHGPVSADVDLFEIPSVIVAEEDTSFGADVTISDDLDGDGLAEIIAAVGSTTSGSTLSESSKSIEIGVFSGPVSATRLAEYPDVRLVPAIAPTWIRGDVDYDDDGRANLLLGNPYGESSGVRGYDVP